MSLEEVMERVSAAASRSGRGPSEVEVVVVSKGRRVAEVERLYRAGHRVFAENRAQDLSAKAPRLPSDLVWHFVGPLQTNKVRLVRPMVRLLHSLDRRSLAEAWVKGPDRPPACLLQVNVGREPQKHGVDPDLAEEACAEFSRLGVEIVGAMCIPPLGDTPEASRPFFTLLRGIRDRLARSWPSVRELSMGMSDDFEVAVEEGSTMIRVGRAIFEG